MIHDCVVSIGSTTKPWGATRAKPGSEGTRDRCIGRSASRIAAALGGDRFAVMLPNLAGASMRGFGVHDMLSVVSGNRPDTGIPTFASPSYEFQCRR